MKIKQQKYPVRFVAADGSKNAHPALSGREINSFVKRYRRWKRRGKHPLRDHVIIKRLDSDGSASYRVVFFVDVVKIEVVKQNGVKIIEL